MFHVTASANVRRVRRLRLGRVADILPNDPDFGWTKRRLSSDGATGRASLSAAAPTSATTRANTVVPFGGENR